MTKQTPLMQQYWEIKSQHTDKVVLFRMGDFFEMFHNDAEVAAPILGIALTQRNKKDADSAKMCGVPHHSIAGPIGKLLAAGHKVAICDQIEDPATAKGIVKRAVTRVLTPGMVYDPDTLDQLSACYLAAYSDKAVAFLDVTTGDAFQYEVREAQEREELLAILAPRELVLAREAWHQRRSEGLIHDAVATEFGDGSLTPDARLLEYVRHMQGEPVLKSLRPFEWRRRQGQMRLSSSTLRHLVVFENSRGGRDGSLFEAINRTRTWAGARQLKSWLMAPIMDEAEIRQRLDEIQYWIDRPDELKAFRAVMGELGDVERRLGKVHASTFNARDLTAIAQSLMAGVQLSRMHPSAGGFESLAAAESLAAQILNTLREDLPIAVKEGGMVRPGVRPDLDELLKLTQDSQSLLLELEEREKTAVGISSLKVRYNNVFGFYIELTKTHAHKAPSHYRRKQTLTNAERFTTDELDRLEEKVLSARSRRDQLEYEIFLELRQQVVVLTLELLALARIWARWDVLSAWAYLALERGYCRPEFTQDGSLHLELCRHPVIEQSLGRAFVPNSLKMNAGDGLLLTGPNMAGKSTLMRQVALLSIMAQVGCFLPAEQARVCLFTEIFTRIGASDAINEGLSTFMVEMSETAEILRRVTSRSLVVMDEIGRGTSTYDGLSLAQSILEFLLSEKKPILLFATHYHELTQLEHDFPSLRNVHMSVQEQGGQIQFLHSLAEGPANRSYGIHVAQLAGLPKKVTQRAQVLLKAFEGSGSQLSLAPFLEAPSPTSTEPEWVKEVRGLDVSRMTPLEALNKLSEWQRDLSS